MQIIFKCSCGYILEISGRRPVKELKENLILASLYGCEKCKQKIKKLIEGKKHDYC